MSRTALHSTGIFVGQCGEEDTMENVAVIGLDLAKSVFQVHGISEDGAVVVRRRLSRSKLWPSSDAEAICEAVTRSRCALSVSRRASSSRSAGRYLRSNTQCRQTWQRLSQVVSRLSARITPPSVERSELLDRCLSGTCGQDRWACHQASLHLRTGNVEAGAIHSSLAQP